MSDIPCHPAIVSQIKCRLFIDQDSSELLWVWVVGGFLVEIGLRFIVIMLVSFFRVGV